MAVPAYIHVYFMGGISDIALQTSGALLDYRLRHPTDLHRTPKPKNTCRTLSLEQM